MLWSAQLLAIVSVVAFALALLIFIRRAAKALADTRETQRFRMTIADWRAQTRPEVTVMGLEDCLPLFGLGAEV